MTRDFSLKTSIYLSYSLIVILFFATLSQTYSHTIPLRIAGKVPKTIDSQHVSEKFRTLSQKIAPHFSSPSQKPIVIYYTDSFNPLLYNYHLPEWGGAALVTPDSIIINVNRYHLIGPDLQTVTMHELIHALLVRAYPDLHIPRWFHEGCALFFSGDISFTSKVQLSRAVFTGSLVAMSDIDSVNLFSSSQAQTAYAQSQAAVAFLIRHYGLDIVPKILHTAQEERDFSKGIYLSLGLTPQELYTLIRTHISKRYGLQFIIGDMFFLWFGILILSIIGFFVRRVQNKRRLIQMASEEDEEIPERLATYPPPKKDIFIQKKNANEKESGDDS